MDDVVLPPEWEQFADEQVADGRFPDKAAVVAAGMELLRRQQAARAEFTASLHRTVEEADREGWFELEDILADLDRVIGAQKQQER